MMVQTRFMTVAALGLVLAASGRASANDAVESIGLLLVVPTYEYSVSSQSGWLDQPRSQRNTLGGLVGGVMPIARDLGVRLAVFGDATRAKSDPAGVIGSRDLAGLVGTEISGFRRDSDRYEIGLGYTIDFAFTPLTTKDRGQRVSAFGALFISTVDLEMGIDYRRGDQTAELSSLGQTQAFDAAANGVGLDAGVTWYPTTGLATGLDAFYGYSSNETETPFGTLRSKTDFGGFLLRASVLPPLPGRGFVVLEGWLGYSRSRTRPNGVVPPPIQLREGGTNSYRVGASLRVVLPGVESLAELRRRY